MVEVLSPSTARIDRGVKFQLYAQYEVPFFWIVDPDAQAIEAYRLVGGGFEPCGRLEGSAPAPLPPLPDLLLTPADLWASE